MFDRRWRRLLGWSVRRFSVDRRLDGTSTSHQRLRPSVSAASTFRRFCKSLQRLPGRDCSCNRGLDSIDHAATCSSFRFDATPSTAPVTSQQRPSRRIQRFLRLLEPIQHLRSLLASTVPSTAPVDGGWITSVPTSASAVPSRRNDFEPRTTSTVLARGNFRCVSFDRAFDRDR